ncbi:MAG: hypothetical protein EXQ52_14675 [Bryobacterales bacterium]|nr:hypothetical protein [Bryobacterales bacterium]
MQSRAVRRIHSARLIVTGIVFAHLGSASVAKPARHPAPLLFHEQGGAFVSARQGLRIELTPEQALIAPAGSVPLRIKLAGAARAELMGEDPLPLLRGNFSGNLSELWRTGIREFRKIRYREAYPGIDVVFYGNGDDIEYDFVLAPGADVSLVRVQFPDARRLSIRKEGSLEVGLGRQRALQRKPVAWQLRGGVRAPVDVRYRLAGNSTAGFVLGDYDRLQPVVIDPVLVYGTYVGGASRDEIRATVRDKAGRLYLAGVTSSWNFMDPYRNATNRLGAMKGADVFVLVIDPALQGPASLIYAFLLGGEDADEPNAIAVDDRGRIYVAGITASKTFPTTANAYQRTFGGAQDAFLSVFDPALSGLGALKYSTYLGGADVDEARVLSVDANGNVFLAGRTISSAFPLKNAVQATFALGLPVSGTASSSSGSGAGNTPAPGSYDVFVCKLNPELDGPLSLLYSTFLGGANNDEPAAMQVDRAGMIYVAGKTSSINFPLINGYRSVLGGVYDGFLAEINPFASGGSSLLYSTVTGGNKHDEITHMALDQAGAVYIAGRTTSTNFAGEKAFRSAYAGAVDVFLAKVSPITRGVDSLEYSTYFGGAASDEIKAMTLDAAGNVYIAGNSSSSNFPLKDGFQPALSGGQDAFLAVFNPAANGTASLLYASYLGGRNNEEVTAVSVDSVGNIYVAGYTGSADFPLQKAVQSGFGGGNTDGFLAKFGAVANRQAGLLFSTFLGGNANDEVSALSVDETGAITVVGNTSSGNFPSLGTPLVNGFGGGSADVFLATMSLCEFDARLANDSFPVLGGRGRLSVSTTNDCQWSVTPDAPWLSLPEVSTGRGNADVVFAVSANGREPARSGRLSVAGKSLTVKQEGVSAQFTATPNPVRVCDGTGRGSTTLTWQTQNVTEVALRVGSATGASLGNFGPAGSYPTDKWVSNGLLFYLVNVSPGLSTDAVLAVQQVDVNAAGCGIGLGPQVYQNGIVNSASLQPGPIAPGSLFAIFGENLGQKAESAAVLPLTTVLAGTRVYAGGQAVPLTYVSPTQINAQLPWNLPMGQTTLEVVDWKSEHSIIRLFQTVPAALGLFTRGTRKAVVQNADGTANDPANPAPGGSILTAYLTGQGELSISIPDGAASPVQPGALPRRKITATLAGTEIRVLYAGMAPGLVGILQVNFQTPSLPPGTYELKFFADDNESNIAFLTVN